MSEFTTEELINNMMGGFSQPEADELRGLVLHRNSKKLRRFLEKNCCRGPEDIVRVEEELIRRFSGRAMRLVPTQPADVKAFTYESPRYHQYLVRVGCSVFISAPYDRSGNGVAYFTDQRHELFKATEVDEILEIIVDQDPEPPPPIKPARESLGTLLKKAVGALVTEGLHGD